MQTYNYDFARERSVEYFNGDETAANVFLSKYALKNNNDELVEATPDDMHIRLAHEFHAAESAYSDGMGFDEIYGLFKDFKYVIPQGSPMSAIGNPFSIQSASNCFVIKSPVDSYGGIFLADQQEAQIMKRRGGVGFDISEIRPRGVATSNAAKTTDGIAVFMDRFSNTCREVAQGGRRGALMLTIAVNHPEIETFINIKRDKKRVTGANISIKLSDAFMEAVKTDSDFTLQWPVDSKEPSITKVVSAKSIWNQIILAAWESAEPGLLFWDNALKNTPSDVYGAFGFRSTATNPCGEIILPPNDSCRLMAINLYNFVNNMFESNAEFDFDLFENIVYKAQHLMDSMIDIEIGQVDKIIEKIVNDPEEMIVKQIELDLWKGIREAAKKGRRTGLGVTGLGDALAALGIRYGSQESIEMTERIYKAMATSAYRATIDMAETRGAFEVFDYTLEQDHEFLSRVINAIGPEYVEKWKRFGRRNIALTTTAPTGSVSMMTQTTSGIEPAFMVSYVRRKKINANDVDLKVCHVDALGDKFTEFKIFHHGFKKWMDVTGNSDTDIEKSPYNKATSNDVDWLASVEIQAVAQKWICHSISKTCNLPNSATKELVADVYMSAWERGCKGFTVYRDGCRDGVLIDAKDSKESAEKAKYDAEYAELKAALGPEGFKQFLEEGAFNDHDAPKRPKELNVEVNHVRIGGEQWTIFVGLYNNRPYEVFGGIAENIQIPKKIKSGKVTKTGKTNGRGIYTFTHGEGEDKIVVKDIVTAFANADYAFHTLAVSGMLRHGTPVQFILDILGKTSEDSDLYSFNKVLSRVLKHHVKDGVSTGEVCPSCGAKMIFIEGCRGCTCGYSKC